MALPDQIELLKFFSSFLFEAGLSAVSVKNYLSDLRHFLTFCSAQSIRPGEEAPTVKDIFHSIDRYLEPYKEQQKASFTPASTTARRLASIRRFSTFLSVKFGLTNIFTAQSTSNNIKKNAPLETHHTTSTLITPLPATDSPTPESLSGLSSNKILEQFKSSLEREKKSHSTIKNYLSDLNHFFLWTANQTPFTDQNLVNILSEHLLQTYVTYLKLCHTSTSVINRRQSSIKKLSKFCFDEGFLPENPFELKSVPQTLAPLAWLERLTHKKAKESAAPKGRLAVIYEKYSSLRWTPYFNLALLVIATTAMAIFAYNQIVSQARPSAAATALTPPKRQLSFQGRLTDSAGTPITTAVSVVFKLFNALTGPTQLYTTGTCSITPDQDGIFNSLIGDGVCGAEITSSVFTDNRDVYLEITVGAETLTPRQQIATVGYAINSFTLQGYPASASATANTVPVMDNNGNIVLGQLNPAIIATASSGTFTIKGDSLAFQTNVNSGGDIIFQPDALGSGQILALGGTTTEDSFRITNANLTSGALLSGYVGNDLVQGRLISLTSGSTPTDRFWVATDGRSLINASATDSALIVNNNGSGALLSASASGLARFTLNNLGAITLLDGVAHTIDDVAGNLTLTSNSSAVSIADDLYLASGLSTYSTAVSDGTLEAAKFCTGDGETNCVTDFSSLVAGAGYWTQAGGVVYPTTTTNDLAIGGTSVLASMFGIDESAGNFYFGYDNSANPTLNFEATDADAGEFGFNTNDSFFFSNANVGIGTVAPTAILDVVGDASVSASFVMRSATPTIDVLNGSSLVFQTSPGGDAGLAAKVTLLGDGSLGIGDSTPLSLLTVGSGDKFQVDTNGNIVKINNVTTSFPASQGALNTVLTNDGAGTLTWGSPTALVASAIPWIEGAGILYPKNSTVDLLVGGQATSSAKFAILNLNSGTPTASLAGTVANQASFFDGNGNLATTNRQSLVLGNSATYNSTGNILLNPNGTGSVGIGVTNPQFLLDVAGTASVNSLNVNDAYTLPTADGSLNYVLQTNGAGVVSWAAQTGGSGNNSPWDWNTGVIYPFSITDAVNLGNAATASATVHLAGTAGDDSFVNTGQFGIGLTNPAYTLDVFGDINLSGGIRASSSFGSPGDILSSTGTGVQWIAASSGSGSNWNVANGTIFPKILSVDELIGGNSTASAKFAFINVNAGTPTASISSQVANVNTYLTGDGTLATTNRNNLTLGNSATYDTTGNVLINPNGTGNVGIGLTNPAYKLEVTGTAKISSTVNLDSLTASRLVVTDGSKNLVSTITSANLASSISDETGTLKAVFSDAPTFTTSITDPLVIGGTAVGSSLSLQSTSGNGTTDFINLKVGNNGGTEAMRVVNSGRIGIGTTVPLATLDIRGNLGTIPVASISGATNQPALLVDQSGTGDIFDASSSGQTRFKISNNGTITTSLGTGIVHSSSLGVLSSSAIDLAASDVTGILPLANGGTNNNNIISPYVSSKFLAYDGTRFVSTAFDGTSFDAPLTFSNGLTRTVNNIVWGGTLTGATTIAQAGFDVAFTGTGNFGIGVASPSQKLDVAGVFVVDSVNGRVGIGTTTPTTVLDIGGLTSTISNSSGDITLNAASGFINFSGNSLNNFLDATLSGRLQLGAYPTAGLPTANAGMMVYDSTVNYPVYYNGSSWNNLSNFFTRTSTGIIYPTSFYDSINVGGTPSATASALVRLSSSDSFYSFFYNPVALGFRSGAITGANTMLESEGSIIPHTTATWSLGGSTLQWQNLFLANGISSGVTQVIDTAAGNYRLTGGQWNATTALRVGDTVNTIPTGMEFYVVGDATISGTFGVVGTSSLIGDVTVGGGTGKIDVGTVDPPYTINGEKYGTFMAGMIGVKDEVMGKVSPSEFVEGLGYRAIIDLNAQPKGSDLWLFSKTTNLKNNLGNLSVLLTAAGQAKTWYEIDDTNKLLAIYSTNPTDVIYRLTAPRFDAAKWTNTRTSQSVGFVINDNDVINDLPTTGIFGAGVAPELIAQADNSFTLKVNGRNNQEVSSFFESIVANLKVGTQVVTNLLADNLTIRTKLISPYADIDSLKTINATISGTLYADNIKGQTIDVLNLQLDLLNEKYSTASAILADLQAKYTSYDAVLGSFGTATISGNPLELSPLATTSANIPSDLALNSLSVHTLYTNDLMANGSIFTQSLSSFDGDLFIQPTGDKPVHLLANLMTLYPDGKVVINGDLLITGVLYANGLDTRTATVSGTLALGRGSSATDSGKLITLFDKDGLMVGSVDASGSAKFGQLVTGGLVIASGNENTTATISAGTATNTTIGTATIATGSAEIAIASNKVTASTLIYLTPITNTSNQVLYVKSKQAGVGFTVAVPANPSQVKEQISFNYWLVETK